MAKIFVNPRIKETSGRNAIIQNDFEHKVSYGDYIEKAILGIGATIKDYQKQIVDNDNFDFKLRVNETIAKGEQEANSLKTPQERKKVYKKIDYDVNQLYKTYEHKDDKEATQFYKSSISKVGVINHANEARLAIDENKAKTENTLKSISDNHYMPLEDKLAESAKFIANDYNAGYYTREETQQRAINTERQLVFNHFNKEIDIYNKQVINPLTTDQLVSSKKTIADSALNLGKSIIENPHFKKLDVKDQEGLLRTVMSSESLLLKNAEKIYTNNTFGIVNDVNKRAVLLAEQVNSGTINGSEMKAQLNAIENDLGAIGRKDLADNIIGSITKSRTGYVNKKYKEEIAKIKIAQYNKASDSKLLEMCDEVYKKYEGDVDPNDMLEVFKLRDNLSGTKTDDGIENKIEKNNAKLASKIISEMNTTGVEQGIYSNKEYQKKMVKEGGSKKGWFNGNYTRKEAIKYNANVHKKMEEYERNRIIAFTEFLPKDKQLTENEVKDLYYKFVEEPIQEVKQQEKIKSIFINQRGF